MEKGNARPEVRPGGRWGLGRLLYRIRQISHAAATLHAASDSQMCAVVSSSNKPAQAIKPIARMRLEFVMGRLDPGFDKGQSPGFWQHSEGFDPRWLRPGPFLACSN